MSKIAHLIYGRRSESKALQLLQSKGYRLVQKNYRCNCGEIDLIMQDGTTLVFIEVRSRSSQAYGGALESIDYGKQQKIIKTAVRYLYKHNIYDKVDVRFDLVCISGAHPPELITNAFELLHGTNN